jgi:hypothetical protein
MEQRRRKTPAFCAGSSHRDRRNRRRAARPSSQAGGLHQRKLQRRNRGAEAAERRRANMAFIHRAACVSSLSQLLSQLPSQLTHSAARPPPSPDTCRPSYAFPDFPCPHPLAPAPRDRLGARGVRAAMCRRAVANASAKNASALRRPTLHLTQLSPCLKPRRPLRGLFTGRRADHIRMLFPRR